MYPNPNQPAYHGMVYDVDLYDLFLSGCTSAGEDSFDGIDPKLHCLPPSPGALSNLELPDGLVDDANASFYNLGQQPWLTSNSSYGEPLLASSGYPKSFDRSSTPRSQAHPAIGNDGAFAYSQASPGGQGNMGFLSPPLSLILPQPPVLLPHPPRGPVNPTQTQLGMAPQSSVSFGLGGNTDAESEDLDELTPRKRSYRPDSQYPDRKMRYRHPVLAPAPAPAPAPACVTKLCPSPDIKTEEEPTPDKLPKNDNPERKQEKHGERAEQSKRKSSAPKTGVSKNRSPKSGGKKKKQAASVDLSRLICKLCSTPLDNLEGLEDHIRVKHNRPFTCIFLHAGCHHSFTAKNEWKRHVNTQHLQATYYLCTQGECATFKNARNMPAEGSDTDPNLGKVFNRKDLHDEHFRRQHQTGRQRSLSKAEWGNTVAIFRAAAARTRCSPPQHMDCPAPGCSWDTQGDKAWAQWLEHIAQHVEKAACGDGPPVRFGPKHSRALWAWASTLEFGIIQRTSHGWELCKRIQSANNQNRPQATESSDSNQDTNGSDC